MLATSPQSGVDVGGNAGGSQSGLGNTPGSAQTSELAHTGGSNMGNEPSSTSIDIGSAAGGGGDSSGGHHPVLLSLAVNIK